MLIVEKSKEGNGVLLKGDFFDLDRLYFAIFKYTGFHGPDNKCIFPEYDAICENLLGLCYEIRHAWQGDRDIEQVYNGIRKDWFDDYKEPGLYKTTQKNNPGDQKDEDDEYLDMGDSYLNDEFNIKFFREDFPHVTENNTYFSIPITFTEAVFYSLIILELLRKKDIFLLARKLLAEKNDSFIELNKEYNYFQANEDIARITLFTNHVLHTLYKFIGEEKYLTFINKFYNQKDFFLKCDLERINSILVDYGEKEFENDDPDYLFRVLLSFFDQC